MDNDISIQTLKEIRETIIYNDSWISNARYEIITMISERILKLYWSD